MKRVKVILFIVSGTLILFIFSTWKYQQLINEGSEISDEECLKVNPLMINRKNSYINSLKIMQSSGSADQYWAETNKYLDFSKKYIAAQKEWLGTQKAFRDRQDYNIFVPSNIREADKSQYISRDAEMKAVAAIVEFFETYKNIDSNQQKELSNTILDETKKSNDAYDQYNKIYHSYQKGSDFRDNFVQVPQSKCPIENFNIPNVQDILNPQTIPANTPLS